MSPNKWANSKEIDMAMLGDRLLVGTNGAGLCGAGLRSVTFCVSEMLKVLKNGGQRKLFGLKEKAGPAI